MSFAKKAGSGLRHGSSDYHEAKREAGHLKIILRAGSVLLSIFFLTFIYGGLAGPLGTGFLFGNNNAVMEAITSQTDKAMEQANAARGTSKRQCVALVDEHGAYDADEHLSLKAAMEEDSRQRIRISDDDRAALKLLEKLRRCSFHFR